MVDEAGSTVTESSDGGELGRINLAGAVVKDPRSRGGGSKMLSGE